MKASEKLEKLWDEINRITEECCYNCQDFDCDFCVFECKDDERSEESIYQTIYGFYKGTGNVDES